MMPSAMNVITRLVPIGVEMTKTFEIKNNILTAVFDCDSCCGSISYNFDTGELLGHKPDTMFQSDWLICCRKTIAIIMKLNAPFLD